MRNLEYNDEIELIKSFFDLLETNWLDNLENILNYFKYNWYIWKLLEYMFNFNINFNILYNVYIIYGEEYTDKLMKKLNNYIKSNKLESYISYFNIHLNIYINSYSKKISEVFQEEKNEYDSSIYNNFIKELDFIDFITLFIKNFIWSKKYLELISLIRLKHIKNKKEDLIKLWKKLNNITLDEIYNKLYFDYNKYWNEKIYKLYYDELLDNFYSEYLIFLLFIYNRYIEVCKMYWVDYKDIFRNYNLSYKNSQLYNKVKDIVDLYNNYKFNIFDFLLLKDNFNLNIKNNWIFSENIYDILNTYTDIFSILDDLDVKNAINEMKEWKTPNLKWMNYLRYLLLKFILFNWVIYKNINKNWNDEFHKFIINYYYQIEGIKTNIILNDNVDIFENMEFFDDNIRNIIEHWHLEIDNKLYLISLSKFDHVDEKVKNLSYLYLIFDYSSDFRLVYNW